MPSQQGTGDASVEDLLAAAERSLAAAYDRVGQGWTTLPEETLIEQAVAMQRVQNIAWAFQSHRLAQVAAIEHRDEADPVNPGYLTTRPVRHEPGTYVDEWTPLEIGTRLGWSDRQTQSRLGQACDALVMPALLDRAGAGGLDPRKVTAVADLVAGAPPAVVEHIEQQILAGEPELSTSTKLRAKTRRLVTRLAPVSADQASATRRRDRAGVFVEPHHEPGLSILTAILPTLDAARLMAAVDELARDLHLVTTTDKTLPECRVDALTDLTLSDVTVETHLRFLIPLRVPQAASVGPVTPPTTALSTTVPSTTATSPTVARAPQLVRVGGPEAAATLGDSPGWGEWDWYDQLGSELDRLDEELEELIAAERGQLPDDWRTPDPPTIGNGRRLPDPQSIPAGRRAPRSPSMRSPSMGDGAATQVLDDVLVPKFGVIPATVIRELAALFGTKVSRALTDPATGAVVETSDLSYRPGARLARFVKARDGHCRFPGCTRPAELCDLDHVIPFPQGQTAAHNLQSSCRHHHRAKHEGGWRITMTPGGICTWVSPHGHTYVTHPGD